MENQSHSRRQIQAPIINQRLEMERGHLINSGEEFVSPTLASNRNAESRDLPRIGNVITDGRNCGAPAVLSCSEHSSFPSVRGNLSHFSTFASPSAPFQHPFAPHQKAQLRAQIVVTGSLKKGGVPNEKTMVAAFGESDGGRTLWEKSWRMATKRHEKSPVNTPRNTHSSSGGRLHESALQSKVVSTPAAGGEGASSVCNDPFMSMSSPLWTIPSCFRDGSSSSSKPRSSLLEPKQSFLLPAYQSPKSQASPPQTSAFGAPGQCSQISEAVHVSSFRQTSEPSPTSPSIHNRIPKSFSTETPLSVEVRRTRSSSGKHISHDTESRKRNIMLHLQSMGKSLQVFILNQFQFLILVICVHLSPLHPLQMQDATLPVVGLYQPALS